MNKKIVIGFIVGIFGAVVVVGLAYGLAKHLNGPEEDQSTSMTIGQCCKKLMISGTINKGDFYQEMMGEYVINKDYPKLDFTQNANVGDVSAQKVFPVYAHQMFADDPQNSQKHAFLYFYYNTEPRKMESQCPEGCWIISMYDMTPGNFWYGNKYYYMKKPMGKIPPTCPDHLTKGKARFTNQDEMEDPGLQIECVDSSTS